VSARHLERDGVAVGYTTTGRTGPDVLLMPGWQLVDSRLWDAQVAALAPHARVTAFDARGSGRSGRPRATRAYAPAEIAGDAVAVLDAVGVDRAVVVGNSAGGALGLLLAALRPDRVAALVLVGPTVDVVGDGTAPMTRAVRRFEEDLGPGEQGWARYNRHAWRRDFPGFVRWFVESASPEPQAAGLREQVIGWGCEQDPAVLAHTVAARAGGSPAEQAARFRALADRVRCPAVVVHGERDALPGIGHCPQLTVPTALAEIVVDALERTPA
jgi:pimeloyl-ACP methyl ester carboxylesterase